MFFFTEHTKTLPKMMLRLCQQIVPVPVPATRNKITTIVINYHYKSYYIIVNHNVKNLL